MSDKKVSPMFVNVGEVTYDNPEYSGIIDDQSSANDQMPSVVKSGKTTFLLCSALDRSQDATVFKSINLFNGKKYVVKILHEDYPKKDEIEANLTNQSVFSSSGILELILCEQTEKYLYFVFPYCQNGDLFHYILEHGPITNPKCLVNVLYSMTLAVKFLHDEAMIHNHLRPQSFLLSDHFSESEFSEEKFQTLLSGFSHSMKESDIEEETEFDFIKPDDIFIAPELLAPPKVEPTEPTEPTKPTEPTEPWVPKPSKATDIYSLGVTFYMIVMGYSPTYIEGQVRKILEQADRNETDKKDTDYRFHNTKWESKNFYVRELIQKMMKSDPKERFTIEDVMSHRYFDSIKDRKVNSPMISEIIQSTQKEYLDNMPEEEESPYPA